MSDASDLSEHFRSELQSGSLARVALAIAAIAFPMLEPEAILVQLGAMAEQIAARVDEAAPGGTRALALVQAMRLELGFRGNAEHYYDASNSFLNVVLETRTGLPIMLSLVVVEIGRRLGLDVDGVGFPGHFMVRYVDEDGVWFLDPFHGAVMTPEDVPAYFLKLFGKYLVEMDASYFTPLPLESWAIRILNNLYAVYLRGGELAMLANVLPLMLVLEPRRPELWRESGLVAYRRGELGKAARALRRFFYLQGYIVLNSPIPSVLPSPPAMDGEERQLWDLLEEIEAARTRWN